MRRVSGWIAVGFLAACSRAEHPSPPPATPPPATSADASASGAPAFGDEPRATALCAEVFPCPPHPAGEVPYMCSLGGRRDAPEHVPGLTIETVHCRYRKVGESAVLGVPDDGSRPLVRDDALLARVRGFPRAHAKVAIGLLTGHDLDESCPVTEQKGLLRYCVHAAHLRNRYQCVVTHAPASACTTNEPAPLLALCQAALGEERVVAEELYWGPGINVVAADHVRGGHDAVATSAERNHTLRAGGKEVRTLSCHGRSTSMSLLVVDGTVTRAFSVTELLPKLDTPLMRAALLGTGTAGLVTGTTTYLLTDARGDAGALWPKGACALPAGPRQTATTLSFTMAPPIDGPRVACEVDTTTWRGACAPIAQGRYCD